MSWGILKTVVRSERGLCDGSGREVGHHYGAGPDDGQKREQYLHKS